MSQLIKIEKPWVDIGRASYVMCTHQSGSWKMSARNFCDQLTILKCLSMRFVPGTLFRKKVLKKYEKKNSIIYLLTFSYSSLTASTPRTLPFFFFSIAIAIVCSSIYIFRQWEFSRFFSDFAEQPNSSLMIKIISQTEHRQEVLLFIQRIFSSNSVEDQMHVDKRQ